MAEDCIEVEDCDEVVEVVDLRNLCIEDEINTFDMTSLRTMLLLEKSSSKINGVDDIETDDDLCVQRLSLAYERLHSMPKIVMEGISGGVKILDISHNEFESLDFLKHFKQLTSLICDHNNITSNINIPFLPTLELLWLNHCKIGEFHEWARKLKFSCPNLRYLSLMKNPIILSYRNSENNQEILEYRLYLISLFPNLIHLDDKIVTSKEKKEASKLYSKHFVERMVSRTHESLPEYLRVVTQRIYMMLTPSPKVSSDRKNNVVI